MSAPVRIGPTRVLAPWAARESRPGWRRARVLPPASPSGTSPSFAPAAPPAAPATPPAPPLGDGDPVADAKLVGKIDEMMEQVIGMRDDELARSIFDMAKVRGEACREACRLPAASWAQGGASSRCG